MNGSAYSQPTTGGGFTCARCGSFVLSGAHHECWGIGISPQQVPYMPTPHPTGAKWDRTQEILDAIGALTAAVDRLVVFPERRGFTVAT